VSLMQGADLEDVSEGESEEEGLGAEESEASALRRAIAARTSAFGQAPPQPQGPGMPARMPGHNSYAALQAREMDMANRGMFASPLGHGLGLHDGPDPGRRQGGPPGGPGGWSGGGSESRSGPSTRNLPPIVSGPGARAGTERDDAGVPLFF
jgi:hypothetical protein